MGDVDTTGEVVWPSVYVVLLTFDRLDYACTTLRSLFEYISYPCPISVHIADDGSKEGHRETLMEIASESDRVESVTVSNAERGGYGKSYNLAMQTVHCDADIVLPLEDDWQLTRELDLAPLVQTLQEGVVGCIRLGYIGYTQELRCRFQSFFGSQYLVFDPESPEPHIAAGHPRLETKAWERNVGPWIEGVTAGETEFEWCHRPEARQGVAWPVDLVHPRGDLFAHIGSRRA